MLNNQIKAKLQHLVEHLHELGQYQMCGTKKARLFGLFFDKLPTYAKLAGGTTQDSIFTEVNPLFLPTNLDSILVGSGSRIRTWIAGTKTQSPTVRRTPITIDSIAGFSVVLRAGYPATSE